MSTNYYLCKNGPTTNEPIHIGKSSYGWLFCFQSQNHPYDEPGVVWNTYNQVKAELKRMTVDSTNYVIIDEYDSIISYDDFIKLVDEIQADPDNQENPDNFSYDTRNVDGYRFTDGDFW